MHQATVNSLRVERCSLSDWQAEKREERPCVRGQGLRQACVARTDDWELHFPFAFHAKNLLAYNNYIKYFVVTFLYTCMMYFNHIFSFCMTCVGPYRIPHLASLCGSSKC